MIRYQLNIYLRYFLAILIAFLALVLLYSLFLTPNTLQTIEQSDNTPVALGLSAIAVIAPIVAIMEALISWMKLWRESRINSELVKVIDAQSTSPKGMDISALERETKLPRNILQDRVNELILLGRIGVRLTPNNSREYFLIGTAKISSVFGDVSLRKEYPSITFLSFVSFPSLYPCFLPILDIPSGQNPSGRSLNIPI